MKLSDAILFELKGIESNLETYRKKGFKLFATSSFQTHSIPLLHILSERAPDIPVYYMNTGFLFPKTLRFKDELQARFQLNFVGLESEIPKSNQRDGFGNFYFTSEPDYCCHLNKIQPLEPILAMHDVWINGIRADQNANRRNMQVEQEAKHGSLRYHPMLNWTSKMIWEYRKAHDLPEHPMEKEGYLSIGCEPCTNKYLETQNERDGRWRGLKKDECGLHTDLAGK
jgi:phosphoadenosine phosphosulfate reductase